MALLLTPPAFARPAPPLPSCSDLSLTDARRFATAALRPEIKDGVPFRPDRNHAENAGVDGKAPPSTLLPRQQVIISDEIDDRVCAHLPVEKGTISGWLPANMLSIHRELPIPTLKDWTGSWDKLADPDDQIVSFDIAFAKQKGVLSVKGVAGSYSSTGSVEGTAKPKAIYLGGPDLECRIVLIWIDGLLVVDDLDHRCSGAGVDFVGLYRRHNRAKAGR